MTSGFSVWHTQNFLTRFISRLICDLFNRFTYYNQKRRWSKLNCQCRNANFVARKHLILELVVTVLATFTLFINSFLCHIMQLFVCFFLFRTIMLFFDIPDYMSCESNRTEVYSILIITHAFFEFKCLNWLHLVVNECRMTVSRVSMLVLICIYIHIYP